MIRPAAHWIARNRRRRRLRALERAARSYLASYGNCDYDPTTNGEHRVLDRLATLDPKVVFDVGASVGDWTQAALERCPDAHVHCFELALPTLPALLERYDTCDRVTVNPLGLSASEGELTVSYHPEAPELTSVLDLGLFMAPGDPARQRLQVPVTTGSAYCAVREIEAIDFLKVDTEGLELAVLRGFGGMLDAVRALQFEYGLGSIHTKDLLRDFHQLLEARGFVLGKIFPTYVEFRPYRLADEDFLGPNYLAVRPTDVPVFR